MISPQEALIYTMVATEESDLAIADAEINLIGDVVNHLPTFRGLSRTAISDMAARCSNLLTGPNGREQVFDLVREALPVALRETAYALACDVISVDGRLNRAEIGILEEIRTQLEVDPAMAGAIEQVAEVRFKAA
jgi:uncharacterized membrane protein YebE (DUF533 family)